MSILKLNIPASFLLFLLVITSCEADPITREYYSDDGFNMTLSGAFDGISVEKTFEFPLYEDFTSFSSFIDRGSDGYELNVKRRSSDYNQRLSFGFELDSNKNVLKTEFFMRLEFFDDSSNIIFLEYDDGNRNIVISEFQFAPETGSLTFAFSDSVKVPFEDITYTFKGDASVKLFKLRE